MSAATPVACAVCGSSSLRAPHRLVRGGVHVIACQCCSLRHRPFLRRAAFVSLAVGSCLTLINQGDQLLAAHFTAALWWKVPLTYVVPFLVSWLSSVATARSMAATARDVG